MQNAGNRTTLSRLENNITSLEEELILIAGRLERSDLESIEIIQLEDRYQDITSALEALLEEWELAKQ